MPTKDYKAILEKEATIQLKSSRTIAIPGYLDPFPSFPGSVEILFYYQTKESFSPSAAVVTHRPVAYLKIIEDLSPHNKRSAAQRR